MDIRPSAGKSIIIEDVYELQNIGATVFNEVMEDLLRKLRPNQKTT